MIGLGYIPGVDNFSHLGGLLMGLIVSSHSSVFIVADDRYLIVWDHTPSDHLDNKETHVHRVDSENSNDPCCDYSLRCSHTEFLYQ